MVKHPITLMLSCLMAMAIFVCGVGCGSSDEANKVAVSPPPASETSQPGSQEIDTGLQTATTGPDVSTPETDPLQTETESTGPETPDIAEGSSDSVPPAEFALVSGLWETHTKSAPFFTHDKHTKVHEVACNECHHVYEQGKNVWEEGMPVQKCEACHDEPTIRNEKKLPPDMQKRNLKLAFHGNCRGCHKPLKKENPESQIPVTCSQCHPKKK